MSDLVAGRYPIFYEEWALDGAPLPPYRQSIKRSDIMAAVTLTSAQLYVFAMAFQPGDIVAAINVGVNTATGTGTHGWAALYTGTGASSTLITQSTDLTTGFTTSATAQKFTLNTPYLVGGTPGTPQGSAYTGGNSGQAIILGVALYNSGASGGTLDGMTGSAVAGGVIVTGQAPLVSKVALAATATAPSTLAGIAAFIGGVPYIAVSRS